MNNDLNPAVWQKDAPSSKSDDIGKSTAYLDKHNLDLWERRVGRYCLFLAFIVGAVWFLWSGLVAGCQIIECLSKYNNEHQTMPDMPSLIIYPVVVCTLFLSVGLTLALTLLRATYRHPTDKTLKTQDNTSVVDIATPVVKAVEETIKTTLGK